MPSSRLDSRRNSVQNGVVESFPALTGTIFVSLFMFAFFIQFSERKTDPTWAHMGPYEPTWAHTGVCKKKAPPVNTATQQGALLKAIKGQIIGDFSRLRKRQVRPVLGNFKPHLGRKPSFRDSGRSFQEKERKTAKFPEPTFPTFFDYFFPTFFNMLGCFCSHTPVLTP